MDEKLARIEEVLFKLYISNDLESEKSKKSLNRKAKALELEENALNNFISKRLDKYSQAEDFLNDECTKNPIPEDTKKEFLELCVDLEIPEEWALQLLARKLSAIPRELTPEEKEKEARLQRSREQGAVLKKEHKTDLPKTGFSFSVSKANSINVYYFIFQNAVEKQWNFFTDTLKSIESGAQITEDFMKQLAVSTIKPLFDAVDEIIKDNKEFARSLSNDGDYTGKFETFFQACIKIGRNAQQAWEQGQFELAVYNEARSNNRSRSSSIVVGNLGFMVGYAAIKGISAAAGKISEKIQEHKFASEVDARFLGQFQSGAIPYFSDIYGDCVSALWGDVLFRLDTHDYFTFTETYLPTGETFLKLLQETTDLSKNKDKIESAINNLPWFLPLWSELISRYEDGSEEKQELLDYASSLTPLHCLFFAQQSKENKKSLLMKKVPTAWQDVISTLDADVAIPGLKKLIELQQQLKQANFNKIAEIADELRTIASTNGTQEYLNAVLMAETLQDKPTDLHKQMISHLFCFSPLSDDKFSLIENKDIQKKLQNEKKFIEKYITGQDFQLYDDADTAARQLNQLLEVFALEEKGEWDSVLGKLTDKDFLSYPAALLTWHRTVCSLMSDNNSLAVSLSLYSGLSNDARKWLFEYEKKIFPDTLGSIVKQFFLFAYELWTSAIGKQIEKQIPSKKKSSIIAQITAVYAFLMKGQKDCISKCAAEINEESFRYAESLGGLYDYLGGDNSDAHDKLTKFLTDFPDIVEEEIALILGTQNQAQIAAVSAACDAIRCNFEKFDKTLLANIMHKQPQMYAARYKIFSEYLELRNAELQEDWDSAAKKAESLQKIKQYGSYFEIAKLYFDLLSAPENKTIIRSYVENGITLADLQKHWPHGKWDNIFAENHQTIISEHKTVIRNSGIIDLSERLFNYSFTKKYSVCHASDTRILKTILPEINAALKKSCGLELMPGDVLASFRSTQSHGVITPWGMVVYYKSTQVIKHTYWINAVKGDRCWGATLKIVLKDGTADETSLEAFSYYPIDDLVKICDYMIAFWSDISDGQTEDILRGKFYDNPANWIALFSGERSQIHVFEIAEFEDGEVSRITRETSERTQENLVKNEKAPKNTAEKSIKTAKNKITNSSEAPQKITKSAASAYFTGLNDPKIMVFPDIPREKLENAIKGFGIGINPADIIVLVDNTVSGIADEGLIITLDAMYSKSQFADAKEILFSNCKTLNVGYKKRFLLGYAVEINGTEFASLQLAKSVPELLDGVVSYFTDLKKTDVESSESPKHQPADTLKRSASNKNPSDTRQDSETISSAVNTNAICSEEKVSREVKYQCSKCRKKYPQGINFCSECGGKIEPDAGSNSEQKNKVTVKKKTVKKADNVLCKEEQKSSITKRSFKEIFSGIKDSYIFIAPDIPAKKMNNALASYAPGINANDVIVLVDDTVWGGAKEGMIITKNKLFSKALMESPIAIDISSQTEITIVDNKIIYVNGEKFCSFTMPDKDSLCKLVTAIAEMIKL